ncbi:MAG: Ig-like domain-containing protein [Phycisphaerales bacterium]
MKLQRISAISMMLAAGTSYAAPVNTDFQVHDEASYQAFAQAVRTSQYVRYDYALDQNPRVVVAVAGLIAYASQNPMADSSQLTTFVNAFDQSLSGFAPGDPDLQRSTNLVPAMRYSSPLSTTPGLEGTDTRVGKRIEQLLGLEVPDIESYDTLLDRVSAYERARVADFANREEWLNILMAGFGGFDLDGNTNTHITSVLQSYLESQGYEPNPDGIDDERFDSIEMTLDAALPADYVAYTQLLDQPIESSTAWADLNNSFADIALETQERIDELNNVLSMEESIYQDILDADDPTEMDRLVEEYRARLAEVAQYRAIIDANAMILLQSADPSIQALATQAQSFGGTQLQTNNTIAGITAGVQYASGAATFAIGIATGSPTDAISGLADVVLSSIELGETFGGSPVPSAEEQIFDQLVEMRDQLEDVRVQMNQRFDRIELQLSEIYNAIAVGFNELGSSIFDLNLDVIALQNEIMSQQAQLSRIEQQLWGMADDLFRDDLAALVDGIVAYRDRTGIDLSYSNNPTNFADDIIDLFTKSTFTASLPTYAGGDGTDSIELIAQQLNQNPIGRSINDLRELPVHHLGAPFPLHPGRVVAPGPWAQASTAYARVANESPWYFAYMYESQLDSGLMNPDLDLIIEEGEAIRSMAMEIRTTEFFDTLFGKYTDATEAIGNQFDAIQTAYLGSLGLDHIDPWAGTDQEGRDDAPGYTQIHGRSGLTSTLSAPTVLGSDIWDLYHFNTIPELTAALENSKNASGGIPTVELRVGSNGFFYENDVEMSFRIIIENPGGTDYTFNRRVVFRMTSFGSPVYVGTDSSAQDLFDQTPVFWFNIALQFYTGESLAGTSFNTFNGLGDQITLEYISDDMTFGSETTATQYINQRLDDLQDEVWNESIGNSVFAALESERDSWETIIQAYIELGLPDVFEQSTAVASAFRGETVGNEIALAQPLDDWFASMLGDGDNGQFVDFQTDFATRAQIVQDEINATISPDMVSNSPVQGHSMIEWTLAELRNLRDNAFKLAIDDTYTSSNGSLSVGANDGVISNDVDQEYRVIEVDTGFTPADGYIAPSNGSVTLNPDGSFVYTPAQGFEGTDRFTYRLVTSVDELGSLQIFSDPATVEIRVEGGACSQADLAEGYGSLNFLDVSAFLSAFGANDPISDFNNDGQYNFLDVSQFLSIFSAGCP